MLMNLRTRGVLAAMVVLAAALAGCIFDKGGTYQGGGRRDHGSVVVEEKEPGSSSGEPSEPPADSGLGEVFPDDAGNGAGGDS